MPAEADTEILEARGANPEVVGALGMRRSGGVALRQHLGMLVDPAPMLGREIRIHELRPAERAMVVLPIVAVSAVQVEHEFRSKQDVFLPPQPPVAVTLHAFWA